MTSATESTNSSVAEFAAAQAARTADYRARLITQLQPTDAAWIEQLSWDQCEHLQNLLLLAKNGKSGTQWQLGQYLDGRRSALRAQQEPARLEAAALADHARRSVGTGGSIALPALQSVEGVVEGRRADSKPRLDIDALRAAWPVSALLQRLGVGQDGKKAQCISGRHSDQHYSMHIYDDNRVYCPACDYRAGDVFAMVCDVQGWDRKKDFVRAARWLTGDDTPVEIQRRAAERPAAAPRIQQRPLQPLADAAKAALWAQESPQSIAALEYLLSRGFDGDMIEQAGFGVVDSSVGDELLPLNNQGEISRGWRGRVTIPDFGMHGSVVSLKGRTMEKPVPERKYIKYLAVAGLQPQPYGWQRMIDSDTVLIVEGELDAIVAQQALPDIAVIAVPGVHVFTQQHAEQLAGRRVIVMTDADTALERCVMGDLRDVSDGDLAQHLSKPAAASGARSIVGKLRAAAVDVWVAETGCEGDIGDLLQHTSMEDTAGILRWAVENNSKPLRRKVRLY